MDESFDVGVFVGTGDGGGDAGYGGDDDVGVGDEGTAVEGGC